LTLPHNLQKGDEAVLFVKLRPEASGELLLEMKQTSDAKWYRRLKIIHLSSQQTPVRELAKLFDVCAAAVREYITRYNTGGLTGLKRRSSDGASPKIPLSKAEWEHLLHQSPSQFERLSTGARNWTQELVAEYLAACHEVTVTREAVSLCLKRHGIRWNRGALRVHVSRPALYREAGAHRHVKKKSCWRNIDRP